MQETNTIIDRGDVSNNNWYYNEFGKIPSDWFINERRGSWNLFIDLLKDFQSNFSGYKEVQQCVGRVYEDSLDVESNGGTGETEKGGCKNNRGDCGGSRAERKRVDQIMGEIYIHTVCKIMVEVYHNHFRIFYDVTDKNSRIEVDKLKAFALKYYGKEQIEEPYIYLIGRSGNDFVKRKFYINKYILDINNYNDGFKEVNDKIIDFVKSDKPGLILLHGKPGTGKTFYIRHLVYTVGHYKTILFVSAEIMNHLTKPEFVDFILENPNTLILLEDAETILKKRTNQDYAYSGVSNILNMTDGLLGDCLKIQILATYNTETEEIDSALLRPGRTVVDYEFEYLNDDKAKELFKKLGKPELFEKGKQYTLADIFNTEKNLYTEKKEKSPIGFKKE